MCLVGTTMFSVENIMDLLLYVESKNSALLKGAAMDYIVINKVEVLNKVSFKDAPGTLISNVLAAVARRYMTGVKGESEDDFSTLRMSDLRRKVHEMGMDVDESREMLLSVLKSTMIMPPKSVGGTTCKGDDDHDNEDNNNEDDDNEDDGSEDDDNEDDDEDDYV